MCMVQWYLILLDLVLSMNGNNYRLLSYCLCFMKNQKLRLLRWIAEDLWFSLKCSPKVIFYYFLRYTYVKLLGKKFRLFGIQFISLSTSIWLYLSVESNQNNISNWSLNPFGRDHIPLCTSTLYKGVVALGQWNWWLPTNIRSSPIHT